MDKTTDGGFILGGRSKSKVSGDKTEPNRDTSCGPLQQCSYDYWIVKVDSLGNKEWDKTFGTDSFDDLFAVRQTSDGGYILGGFNYIGINGDKTQASKGNYDYWIVKTDPFGNKEWDKCYGGTQPDHLFCVELTFDGGCNKLVFKHPSKMTATSNKIRAIK